MKMLKGSTISLPAYLEDSNNNPADSQTLTDVRFDINFIEDGTEDADHPADRNCKDGWYAYDYTDTTGKNFIYIVRDQNGTLKNFPGGFVEIIQVEDTSGTHTHADLTTEQTVLTISISSGIKVIRSLRLDLYNLTQTTTIRVKEKIDGTNHRTIDSLVWDTTMDKGVPIIDFYASKDIQVTLQSSVAEGASRSVPYRYKLETL